jgi:hypothetical protein
MPNEKGYRLYIEKNSLIGGKIFQFIEDSRLFIEDNRLYIEENSLFLVFSEESRQFIDKTVCLKKKIVCL